MGVKPPAYHQNWVILVQNPLGRPGVDPQVIIWGKESIHFKPTGFSLWCICYHL